MMKRRWAAFVCKVAHIRRCLVKETTKAVVKLRPALEGTTTGLHYLYYI